MAQQGQYDTQRPTTRDAEGDRNDDGVAQLPSMQGRARRLLAAVLPQLRPAIPAADRRPNAPGRTARHAARPKADGSGADRAAGTGSPAGSTAAADPSSAGRAATHDSSAGAGPFAAAGSPA